MLVKIYGESAEAEKRYSPAECVGCRKERVIGNPDKKQISTSYVERQNLNMRMGMRRFTRLTNAFSKKLENHTAAVSLYFMYYNFVRRYPYSSFSPLHIPCKYCHRTIAEKFSGKEKGRD